VRLRTLGIALAATLGFALLSSGTAFADATCPSDNPIIQENQCSGAGSDGWRITNFDDRVAGFATSESVNIGSSIPLKIGRNGASAPSTVNIDVYRLGYYGNMGGRYFAGASKANVAVNNLFTGCSATDATTGKKSCSSWAVTYTIPGTALGASGEYEAKITDPVGGGQNTIFFTVRDDNAAPKADILFAVPTATYQAYNDWGGKSLYLDSIGGPETISGDPRAVKVSFDRPLADPRRNNTFFGPDFYLVQWLEKQGYDVSYTEDVALHQNPGQLLGHKIDLVSGHSEYWSLEQFNGYLAARNAGVNLASFSSNTSFWKVRYEDSGRTLVCYKTVQGSGSTGSGSDGANDWGPDGIKNTADDALGSDGKVGGTGSAADHPENSTTTFRDDGASVTDPNAPDGATCTTAPSPPPGPSRCRSRPRTRRTSTPATASGATPGSRRPRRPRSPRTSSAGSGMPSPSSPSTWPSSPPTSSRSPTRASRPTTTSPGSRTRVVPTRRRRRLASPRRRRPSSTPRPAAPWSSAPARTTGPTGSCSTTAR
jgi:hypothetical protein